jgi:hypothetical protein
VLLGFKAQHRVTGKFYNIWADDAKDARNRLAGYLKVPLAEIMYAQPSQAMGPDAIRFDPNAPARPAAAPAAPLVPATSAPDMLPWQFPAMPSAAAIAAQTAHIERGASVPARPAFPSPVLQGAARSYSSDYGSILKPAPTQQFEERESRHAETAAVKADSEESDSPSASPLFRPFFKVA